MTDAEKLDMAIEILEDKVKMSNETIQLGYFGVNSIGFEKQKIEALTYAVKVLEERRKG